MVSVIQIVGLLVIVILLIVREVLARRPRHSANPHTDRYKMGDMSVSYWQSEFSRIRDTQDLILGGQALELSELREIRGVLGDIRDKL